MISRHGHAKRGNKYQLHIILKLSIELRLNNDINQGITILWQCKM